MPVIKVTVDREKMKSGKSRYSIVLDPWRVPSVSKKSKGKLGWKLKSSVAKQIEIKFAQDNFDGGKKVTVTAGDTGHTGEVKHTAANGAHKYSIVIDLKDKNIASIEVDPEYRVRD